MLKRLLLLLLLANGMALVAMEPNQPSAYSKIKDWLTGRSAHEQETFGGYFVRIAQMPTQKPNDKAEYAQLLKEVGADFAQKYQKYALSGTPEANVLKNKIDSFIKNHIWFLAEHSKKKQEADNFAAKKIVLDKAIQDILMQQKARL